MDAPRGPRPPWLSPWDLLPLVALAAVAGAWPRLVQGLPDPLPTHFDARGVANGWTALRHLPWLTFGLPLIPWLLLAILPRASAGSEQDPHGRKAEALAPLRGCLTVGVLLLGASPLAIARAGGRVMVLVIPAFVACLALGLALTLRRARRSLPPGTLAHLKWGGLIYANPEDPRLILPKPLGLGWTLNFARPGARWLLALLLLPALVAVLLPALFPR